MVRWLCCVVLVGCGRIAFDPLGTADSNTIHDAQFPPGLIAWYPFDDSAANTGDVVGGANGSCVAPGCPAATPGHHGGAFLFDGGDDCIQVPDHGQLDVPVLTAAIWLRQDVQDNESAFAKRVDVGATVLDSWQLETTTSFQFTLTTNHGSTSNAQQNSATAAFVAGTWYHLALTFDGSVGQVFIDGVPAFSPPNATGPLNYDSHPMWIGCDDNGTSFALHWNGALDDFQIYNRVLSQSEIQTLASQ